MLTEERSGDKGCVVTDEIFTEEKCLMQEVLVELYGCVQKKRVKKL